MSIANLPFHHYGLFSFIENGEKCFYSETPCYKKIQDFIKVYEQNKFRFRESKGNEEDCPTNPTVC
jgi:hypothetical protein